MTPPFLDESLLFMHPVLHCVACPDTKDTLIIGSNAHFSQPVCLLEFWGDLALLLMLFPDEPSAGPVESDQNTCSFLIVV